ncbi:UNVERIFIED_CONTAM: hypothetical protein FKN15_078267 [Acipenser sinensis]
MPSYPEQGIKQASSRQIQVMSKYLHNCCYSKTFTVALEGAGAPLLNQMFYINLGFVGPCENAALLCHLDDSKRQPVVLDTTCSINTVSYSVRCRALCPRMLVLNAWLTHSQLAQQSV